jgi:hypothetical protein
MDRFTNPIVESKQFALREPPKLKSLLRSAFSLSWLVIFSSWVVYGNTFPDKSVSWVSTLVLRVPMNEYVVPGSVRRPDSSPTRLVFCSSETLVGTFHKTVIALGFSEVGLEFAEVLFSL